MIINLTLTLNIKDHLNVNSSQNKCKNKGQTSDVDVTPASASLAFSSPPSVRSETGDGDFPPAVTHSVGVTPGQRIARHVF